MFTIHYQRLGQSTPASIPCVCHLFIFLLSHSVVARVHGRHRARMAVTDHGIYVRWTGTRVTDTIADIMDGGVYRHRKLRHGCACGMADEPDRAQVRRNRIRTTHVHRMDVHIVQSTSENNIIISNACLHLVTNTSAAITYCCV